MRPSPPSALLLNFKDINGTLDWKRRSVNVWSQAHVCREARNTIARQLEELESDHRADLRGLGRPAFSLRLRQPGPHLEAGPSSRDTNQGADHPLVFAVPYDATNGTKYTKYTNAQRRISEGQRLCVHACFGSQFYNKIRTSLISGDQRFVVMETLDLEQVVGAAGAVGSRRVS